MDLNSKDLNLLLVFSTIWQERSISRAANKLFLSQSAVSHSLKKLRSDFNDPLFVKGPRGVSPTDFAINLAPQITSILQQIQTTYNIQDNPNLKTLNKDLFMSTGDYFSMTKLKPFTSHMTKEAPHVRIICQPVANIFNQPMFERGEIDLAITAIDIDKKAGFYIEPIFTDTMACCVRKKHPTLKGPVNLDKYLNEKHINVSNFGKEFGAADIQLARSKKKRRIQTVVSSFFDAGQILQVTDLVLSAPKEICKSLAQQYNLNTYDLNFLKAPRNVSMIWHERTHEDPFHKTIRSIIRDL